jgi:putative SOS response-associated peptidase YedK
VEKQTQCNPTTTHTHTHNHHTSQIQHTMCGRAACSLAPATLREKTGARRFVHEERYTPSHNLSPGRFAAVLVPGGDLHCMRWGLTMARDNRLIVNARAESLRETRSFAPLVAARQPAAAASSAAHSPSSSSSTTSASQAPGSPWLPLRQESAPASLAEGGRCVFLCEGYYEWRNERRLNRPYKQPYYFHDPNRPLLAVAGLFSLQKAKKPDARVGTAPPNPLRPAAAASAGTRARTTTAATPTTTTTTTTTTTAPASCAAACELHFTVITVEAAPVLTFVHDRMPAILSEAQVERWLNPSTSAVEACGLLRPVADLRCHPVADLVSKRFDGPDLIKPLKRKNHAITDFFARSPPRASLKRGSPSSSEAARSPSRPATLASYRSAATSSATTNAATEAGTSAPPPVASLVAVLQAEAESALGKRGSTESTTARPRKLRDTTPNVHF